MAALFANKDRPGSPDPRPDGQAREPAPVEVKPMFEREREKVHVDEASGASAFLGKGSKVTGKLTFEGPARIEGQVEGEIAAQDSLVIGESAVVHAQVNGTSVVVHGQVTGDINARTKLEIRMPSRVTGNISTPSLVIQDGAVFEGQCTMATPAAARAQSVPAVATPPKEERPVNSTPKPSPQFARQPLA
jgi:cytoskeletal protein CcmA (bactofilin family)